MPVNMFSNKRYKVIEAIDKFGVITSLQLEKYLGNVSRTTIFRARQQAINLGYVQERSYGGRSLIAITAKGAKFIGHNYKGESLLNDDMYHRVISNEVLFTFIDDYRSKGVEYLQYDTERDILRDMQLSLSFNELNKPNRVKNLIKEIPDIILYINDYKIAIEIELSPKTNYRLEKKLNRYKESLKNDKYSSVVYVCSNEYIKQSLEKVSNHLNVEINFMMLEDIINSEEV